MKTFLALAFLLTTMTSVSSQIAKIRYSRDSAGVLKPNYCKLGACIKCVDKGSYFGCEKWNYYGSKTKEIHKCDDLNIQERESKPFLRMELTSLDMKKLPNQMGTDMAYCEGNVSQIPFKRNSPNHCTMCQSGMFLLYPQDPLKHSGTKAIACVKPPATSMINCIVGHAFPVEEKVKEESRILYSDAEMGSLNQTEPKKKTNQNPSIVRKKKLVYRCYVCKDGHPSLDLLSCVKPRQFKEYSKKLKAKNFEHCSHGVRASKDSDGFCALCYRPVYSVVGDRLSENFGKCMRIQDDNKGCAKRLNGKCVYCDYYRGYYMTYPNNCEKRAGNLKLKLGIIISIVGFLSLNLFW